MLSPPYPRGFKVRFLQEIFRMRAAQPQEARLNHLTRWYNPPPCRNDRIRLEIPRAQSSARHAKMGMSVMPPVATLPPNFLGIFFGTPIATKMVPKHAHERRSVDPAARSKTAAMPRSRGRNGRISKFCCWGRCGLLRGPPSGTYTTNARNIGGADSSSFPPPRAPSYRSQRTHLRTC